MEHYSKVTMKRTSEALQSRKGARGASNLWPSSRVTMGRAGPPGPTSVPLLASLPAPVVEQLLDGSRVLHCAVDQELISEGREVDGLFFILAGQFEARLPGGNVRAGAGTILGEELFLSDNRASRTVNCHSPGEVLEIRAATVRRVVAENPGGIRPLIAGIRLRLANELLVQHPFSILKSAQQGWLARRLALTAVPRGRRLITQGQQVQDLHLLVHGEVQATCCGRSIRQVRRWGTFGKHSLLEMVPSRVTFTATAYSWLLRLDRRSLHQASLWCPAVREFYASMSTTGGLPQLSRQGRR